MILALDLGTTTGWAMSHPVISGTLCFKAKSFESASMRYVHFRNWLHTLARPSVVYYEEVRAHKGADAAHVYGGMLAVLHMWCEDYDVPYCGVPVGSIKSHATGRGNASKDQMIQAAQARGWMPKDDNEADALWILDWALNQEKNNV